MEVIIDLNPSQKYEVQLLHVVVQLKEMFINMKSNIHDYGDEKLKQKFEVMKRCVTLFIKPFTFLRPTPIALPSKGSIYFVMTLALGSQPRQRHGKVRAENAT
jgi:hypothetical protein